MWDLDFRSGEPDVKDIKQESNHSSTTTTWMEELGTDSSQGKSSRDALPFCSQRVNVPSINVNMFVL